MFGDDFSNIALVSEARDDPATPIAASREAKASSCWRAFVSFSLPRANAAAGSTVFVQYEAALPSDVVVVSDEYSPIRSAGATA